MHIYVYIYMHIYIYIYKAFGPEPAFPSRPMAVDFTLSDMGTWVRIKCMHTHTHTHTHICICKRCHAVTLHAATRTAATALVRVRPSDDDNATTRHGATRVE